MASDNVTTCSKRPVELISQYLNQIDDFKGASNPPIRVNDLKFFYDSTTLTIYIEECSVTILTSPSQLEKAENVTNFNTCTIGLEVDQKEAELVVVCQDEESTRGVSRGVIRFVLNTFSSGRIVVSCCKAPREDLLHLLHSFTELSEFETKFTEGLSPGDLELLLRELKAKKVRITEPMDGWKYRQSLLHDDVTVYLASWLTLDCILNMDTRNLRANDTELESKDLNELLKDWMSGGLQNVESLILHQKTPHDVKDVLEGVEWQLDGRKKKMCIRRGDGRLATLFVDERQFGLSVEKCNP